MQLRTLGDSGLLVSAYALGTMTFGDETPEEDAHAILDRYQEAGGLLLDLADVYAAGESERIVGRWLARRHQRDDVLLATKARFAVGEDADPNRRGLSRRWLHTAIDDSLRRLGVEHVDLYQVHCWDPLTPVEEWLGALDDLVRLGKVRYVGVSNHTGWQLQRVALVARYEGLAPIVSLQPQYNLLAREVEWELLPLCEQEGIGVLPWSPLGGGWLTGKYRRDERPSGATRLGEDPERGVEAYEPRAASERTWHVLDAVREVADRHGASMSAVALAWVTGRPAVSSTILGVRTVEQLEDNLTATDVVLTQDEVRLLDEVSEPPLPDYPYGFVRDFTQDRLGALG
jgi:aryl-alcohol dehydrogenase-like predicted oxidoreductase